MVLRLVFLAVLGVVFVTGAVWWLVLGGNLAAGAVRRIVAPRPRSPFDDGSAGYGYPRGDRRRHA